MDDLKFRNLVNGPLSHPLPHFTVLRLILALKCVVDATGDAGERALDEYCTERDLRDRLDLVKT